MNNKDSSQSKAKTGPMRRNKRIRINFSHRQIEAMEAVFRQTQYPDVTIVEVLSERLQLPVEKICTWFQNRRSKFRKESKKGHIQWMRQQLYSNSDVCSGVPVTSSTPVSASHVLTPPTECEVKKSTPSPQTHQLLSNSYQQQSQVPMTPFCTSTFTSTPSPPHPIAVSSNSPHDFNSTQLPGNACVTSWSNQQPFSSMQQYPGYGDNTMSSYTAACRDAIYTTSQSQYPTYSETSTSGFSFSNIDMSEYYFNKLGNSWSPYWYENQEMYSPGYVTETPQISPVAL